jgi:Family of unknown function (DUF5681)
MAFSKGQSGNPAGKPPGARHKATMLAEKLMGDDAGDGPPVLSYDLPSRQSLKTIRENQSNGKRWK